MALRNKMTHADTNVKEKTAVLITHVVIFVNQLQQLVFYCCCQHELNLTTNIVLLTRCYLLLATITVNHLNYSAENTVYNNGC